MNIQIGTLVVEATFTEVKPISKKQRADAHTEAQKRKHTRAKARQTARKMKPFR